MTSLNGGDMEGSRLYKNIPGILNQLKSSLHGQPSFPCNTEALKMCVQYMVLALKQRQLLEMGIWRGSYYSPTLKLPSRRRKDFLTEWLHSFIDPFTLERICRPCWSPKGAFSLGLLYAIGWPNHGMNWDHLSQVTGLWEHRMVPNYLLTHFWVTCSLLRQTWRAQGKHTLEAAGNSSPPRFWLPLSEKGPRRSFWEITSFSTGPLRC